MSHVYVCCLREFIHEHSFVRPKRIHYRQTFQFSPVVLYLYYKFSLFAVNFFFIACYNTFIISISVYFNSIYFMYTKYCLFWFVRNVFNVVHSIWGILVPGTILTDFIKLLLLWLGPTFFNFSWYVFLNFLCFQQQFENSWL